MLKRNRPEQLHLDLNCGYLEWLDTIGEKVEHFEKSSSKFLKSKPIQSNPNQIWLEISRGCK